MPRLFSTPALLGRSLATAARALAPAPRLRRAVRPDAPRHLLIFSQVAWHDVWHRPQEIAEHFARRLPVTFLSPTPVHRTIEAGGRWVARQTRGEGRLTAHCPAVLPGEYRSDAVRRFNAAHMVRFLRRLGIVPEETALFINSPFVPEIAERFPWGAVIFDWMDDFAGFAWAPRAARDLERRTLARADAFTAGTRFLAERKRPQCGEIHFLQNGVQFEAFAADAPRPDDLPEGFDHVIGYIGTLSDRFDTGLVEALARALPRAAVVLIGPAHGSLGRAPAGDNIFTLGLRPHTELPAWVRHFDVGLIPFRTGPGAEAVNPNKLLEYGAAGVPVISTALPDVEAMFADCAAIARDEAAFIAHVRRALAGEMSAEVERARARARATTWEALAERLWDLIETTWRSPDAGRR